MNIRNNQRITCISMTVMLALFGSIVSAADVVGGANGITLSGVNPASQTVRISGPNGYSNISSDVSARAADGEVLADGLYKFEVVETQCVSLSHSKMAAATRDNAANGRDSKAQPSNCRQVVVESGAFRIVNGAVPDSTLVEE